MFMIIQFLPYNMQHHPGDFVMAVPNEDGSIKLFDTVEEADKHANEFGNTDDLRVISIEGVRN